MRRPTSPILALLAVLLFGTACGTPSTPIVPTQPPPPADTPTLAATATITDTATPESTPTLGVGSSMTSPADGMTLLYVPAGPFQMGSTEAEGGYADEMPQHTVDLAAFWADKTEVTNAMYSLCVKAGACKPPRRNTSNVKDEYYTYTPYADYPVIWVNWSDAQAFCTWAGERLPTEAEWEKAARGTDGRIYPWGNQAPDGSRANFKYLVKDVTQVGQYPAGASFYGLLDMAGNVWEWTADWYGSKYYGQSPAEDPTGPATGTMRVLRGGSWVYEDSAMRAAYRYQRLPTVTNAEIGIRCVMSANP